MAINDNNLLDLWLNAGRLPEATVRALIEDLDKMRLRAPASWQPSRGWLVYQVPQVRETTRD